MKVKTKDAGVVVDVLRIKNGFEAIKNWKTWQDCGYVDIKLNILISDGRHAIIGEIQFLLKWLLDFKKRGHKLYGVKRRSPVVNEVSKKFYNDMNYQRYKNKIKGIVVTHDCDAMTRELLWTPQIVFSVIISDHGSVIAPVLVIIGISEAIKMFKTFLSFLDHYENILLGKQSNFLKKYLNYNSGRGIILNGKDFVKLFGFFLYGMWCTVVLQCLQLLLLFGYRWVLIQYEM